MTTSQPCAAIAPAELDRLAIGRLVGRRARRAEDRHLAEVPIGRENLERITQLAQRPAEDLQIAAAGVVLGQLVGRFADRAQSSRRSAAAWRQLAAGSGGAASLRPSDPARRLLRHIFGGCWGG